MEKTKKNTKCPNFNLLVSWFFEVMHISTQTDRYTQLNTNWLFICRERLERLERQRYNIERERAQREKEQRERMIREREMERQRKRQRERERLGNDDARRKIEARREGREGSKYSKDKISVVHDTGFIKVTHTGFMKNELIQGTKV